MKKTILVTFIEAGDKDFYYILNNILKECRTTHECFFNHEKEEYIAVLTINAEQTMALMKGYTSYRMYNTDNDCINKIVSNDEFITAVSLCMKANIMSHAL